jgi:broad specificity phosphatase PhoE
MEEAQNFYFEQRWRDSVELIFIRHGHGEHLLDYPNRLDVPHPGLTGYGIQQIIQLRDQFPLTIDDIIIVSSTKRTIQTAQLLTRNHKFYVSPYVGPRMFPQSPTSNFYKCDRIYTKEEMEEHYRELSILDFGLNEWGEGINRIDQNLFEAYGMELLEWCHAKGKRTIIVSHDGTITNYRKLLGEKGLTRQDFLGEAGVYKTEFASRSEMK